MKTKLLKKLRKLFSFEYIPSIKEYRVYFPVAVPEGPFLHESYKAFDQAEAARVYRRIKMLDYAEINYSRYRKTIKMN